MSDRLIQERDAAVGALREAIRCLTLIGHVPRQPGRAQSAVRAEAALHVISRALASVSEDESPKRRED